MDQRVIGVISWDEMFMQFAETAARRSKDPKTQVGACIASHDNRVLSIGYNGAPAGLMTIISLGVVILFVLLRASIRLWFMLRRMLS